MAEASSDDFAVVLKSLLDTAEQFLLQKSFGLLAAKDLLTSLWTSHLRDANGSVSEAELLLTVVSTAKRIKRQYFAELQEVRYNFVVVEEFDCVHNHGSRYTAALLLLSIIVCPFFSFSSLL